jgi:hypothetical protein
VSWTCQACKVAHTDDVATCTTCGEVKASWTTVPDRTRTLTVSRGALEVRRGTLEAPVAPADAALEGAELVETGRAQRREAGRGRAARARSAPAAGAPAVAPGEPVVGEAAGLPGRRRARVASAGRAYPEVPAGGLVRVELAGRPRPGARGVGERGVPGGRPRRRGRRPRALPRPHAHALGVRAHEGAAHRAGRADQARRGLRAPRGHVLRLEQVLPPPGRDRGDPGAARPVGAPPRRRGPRRRPHRHERHARAEPGPVPGARRGGGCVPARRRRGLVPVVRHGRAGRAPLGVRRGPLHAVRASGRRTRCSRPSSASRPPTGSRPTATRARSRGEP